MIELTGDIIWLAWYVARPPLNVTEVKLKSTIQNSIGKRKLEKEVQNNESTWMHKSQKASFCRMSSSLQSKRLLHASCPQIDQSGCGPSIFFNFRTSAHCFNDCFDFWARPISSSKDISAWFRVSAQSALAMCWFCSLKKDAELFSEQQPSISNHNRLMFALKILCVSLFEYGHGTHCKTCAASTNYRIRMHESKMHSYRYHARNVGTLCQCASLTMRREIVATRRAGLTTSVIKRIPPKGKQGACIHIMLMTVSPLITVLIISNIFWACENY